MELPIHLHPSFHHPLPKLNKNPPTFTPLNTILSIPKIVSSIRISREVENIEWFSRKILILRGKIVDCMKNSGK